MAYDLSLDTVRAARGRITPYIRHTPLAPEPALTADQPANLRLKLENLQVAGSFKPRGVFNTLLQLDDDAKQRGVIAASGGNHGVALAYAAQRLGIPALVYLPESASADRVARVQVWGAQVIQHGAAWDDAHAQAVEHAAQSGMTYVHPFDADPTLAGQGTLGLELLDDLPELDCVLIAIGGGGLIAGMAAAIKQVKPGVTVIGVEPVGAASMQHSLDAGRVRAAGVTAHDCRYARAARGQSADAHADAALRGSSRAGRRRGDDRRDALVMAELQPTGRTGRRSRDRGAAAGRFVRLSPSGRVDLRGQRRRRFGLANLRGVGAGEGIALIPSRGHLRTGQRTRVYPLKYA